MASGCSLTLCAYNESKDRYERAADATVKLTFSADSIQESAWNPLNADGKLANTEPDYALAPGKTSVYSVQVTIPKDWHGDKRVLYQALQVRDDVVGLVHRLAVDDEAGRLHLAADGAQLFGVCALGDETMLQFDSRFSEETVDLGAIGAAGFHVDVHVVECRHGRTPSASSCWLVFESMIIV